MKRNLFVLLIGLFISVNLIADFLIKGQIVSSENIPIPYANINIENMSVGTVSNLDGYFDIKVPDVDSLTIIISYIGYESKVIKTDISSIINLGKIVIIQKIISFSPLEVIGQGRFKELERFEPSFKFIQSNEIPSIPSIGGKDVFRIFQAMEGVNSTSDYSNQLYIRGGTPDQNLILLNGAPLYQPYHLFGLSSSVNEVAVDYIKYYSGAFSAEYGDYMSSVLDIVTKAGTEKLSGSVDLNPLKTNMSLAGSFGKKFRWRLSGQRSFFDLYEKTFDLDMPYQFSDMEAKISYLPNTKTLITLNVFNSKDIYDEYESQVKYNYLYSNEVDSNKYYKVYDSNVRWNNRLASIRLLKKISSTSNLEATVYYSSLNQGLEFLNCYVPDAISSNLTVKIVNNRNEDELKKDTQTKAKTYLEDYGFDIKYAKEVSKNIYLNSGLNFVRKQMKYIWEISDFDLIDRYINYFMDFPPDTMKYNKSITILNSFAEARIHSGDHWTFRLGVRPTWYSQYSQISIDPRFNVSYAMYPWLDFKFGYGLYSQSLSSSQEYGFYSVANIYLISPKLPVCRHLFFSTSLALPNNIDLSVNLYHKHYKNLLYVESNSELANGSANAYGVDFTGDMNVFKNLYAKFIYCYSVTEKDVNSEHFYPNYDQRNRIVTRLTLKMKRNFSFNVVWNYSSGRPANLVNSVVYIGDSGSLPSFLLDMPKNSFWYPDYHRLDIGIKKTWQLYHTNLTISLDVINVYNRRNVVYYKNMEISYQYGIYVEGEISKIDHIESHDVESFDGFPLLPILGVQYEF